MKTNAFRRCHLFTSFLTFSGIVAVVMSVCTGTLHAQVGTSWTQFFPTGFIDYEVNDVHHPHDLTSFSTGGMTYSNSGGVETFGLVNSTSNRVEHDTDSHYQTGKRQFQGDLQIFSGISEQSCVQIFNAPASGPILMIKGYGANNGTLRKQGGSVTIATNCFGQTFRINLIHDLDNDTLTVYVNGTVKWSGSGGLGGSFNLKYGLYGSFNAATHTVWSNVKFFQGVQTQVYEAESLTISNSSQSTQVIADSNTSGGQFVQLNGVGTGDFFTFLVPNVPAATYDLRVGLKNNHNRAVVQTKNGKVGGAYSNFGPTFDEYSASASYTEVDLGNWTVSSSDKLVGFHVTGKNPSSDGYVIGIDYIKLVPQF